MSTEEKMREDEIFTFNRFSRRQKFQFVYIGALQYFSEMASERLAEGQSEKFYEITKVIKFVCTLLEEIENV